MLVCLCAHWSLHETTHTELGRLWNGVKICWLDTTHQPLVKQCNIHSRLLPVPVVTRLSLAVLIRHHMFTNHILRRPIYNYITNYYNFFLQLFQLIVAWELVTWSRRFRCYINQSYMWHMPVKNTSNCYFNDNV